ncbi:MAG: hypothetical protein CMA63_03395 [Euryarchaeota archaeon]|nr:hypothetical protein [Euryarchaeota archaeon]|tara:strand:- start:64077 stop:64841 length:765 start_codon:yes stop_codon:yes gene_type:complete
MTEEEGTMTPEATIKDLQEKLQSAEDGLKVLYNAYDEQGKELMDARAENEVLEKEIIEREIEKETQEALLSEKEVRVRELELRAVKAGKKVEHLEPELEKMEEKYSREKDRLGKVFGIAEELDNDLRHAVAEMKARDDWYVSHMQIFEDLNKAIKERYEMIERAIESERKSQHMSRAFTDRVDDMVDARAAEMTIEEAEAKTAESETASVDVVEEPVVEPAEEAAPVEDAPVEESKPAADASVTWDDGDVTWDE